MRLRWLLGALVLLGAVALADVDTKDGSAITTSTTLDGQTGIDAADGQTITTGAAGPAAPAFRDITTVEGSTGGDPGVNIGASCVTDDIIVVFAWARGTGLTGSIVASGDTYTQVGSACTSACAANVARDTTSEYWAFWSRHDGTIDTTIQFDQSGSSNAYMVAACYSGAITTGDPFEVKGTWITSTSDPTVVTGITTLTANSLIIVGVGGEDDNNSAATTTGTNPASYTAHYGETVAGNDGALVVSEAARVTTGATGNISVDWDTANPVGSGGVALALIPPP